MAVSTVKINGNTVTLPEIDFAAICDLDVLAGVNLLNGKQTSPLPTLRGVLGLAYGGNMAAAAAELERHLISGEGDDMEQLIKTVYNHINASGFLSKLGEKAKAEKVKRASNPPLAKEDGESEKKQAK